ncbi:MAG: zinc ribbon domain-containing protein [Planctomycetota bacterium]
MIVLPCPACGRAYDVTGFAAGIRVRCACEETFAVPARAPLAVEALVCSHCGGPVGPADEACPWCEAALSAADRRESLLCPRCLARIAADSRHCRSCGAEVAPQAPVAIPAGGACPRCGGGLGWRDLGRTSVVDCERCGGLWLSPGAFEDACRRAAGEARFLAAPPPDSPARAPGGEEVRYIPCLVCGELMNRRQFRHRGAPSTVILDHCREHGVWLDQDELARILAFVGAGGGGAEPPEREFRGLETPRRRPPAGIGRPSRPRGVVRSVLDVLETLGWALFGG